MTNKLQKKQTRQHLDSKSHDRVDFLHRCSSCFFFFEKNFDPSEDERIGFGECQFAPPSTQGRPRVHQFDSCGSWKIGSSIHRYETHQTHEITFEKKKYTVEWIEDTVLNDFIFVITSNDLFHVSGYVSGEIRCKTCDDLQRNIKTNMMDVSHARDLFMRLVESGYRGHAANPSPTHRWSGVMAAEFATNTTMSAMSQWNDRVAQSAKLFEDESRKHVAIFEMAADLAFGDDDSDNESEGSENS